MPTVEVLVDLKKVVSRKGRSFLYEQHRCNPACLKILQAVPRITERLRKQRHTVKEWDEESRQSYLSHSGYYVQSENFPSILTVDRRILVPDSKPRVYLVFQWRFCEVGSTAVRWGEAFTQRVYLSKKEEVLEDDDLTGTIATGVLRRFGSCLERPAFQQLVSRAPMSLTAKEMAQRMSRRVLVPPDHAC